MKKQFLSLLALPFAFTFCMAQTDDKAPQAKEEHRIFHSKDGKKKEITIDKDENGKHEKMTIVIDGDNITINGKPMGDLKGKLKMLNDMDFDFNDMPGNDMAMGPRMQQFKRFNFRNDDAQGNKALLGVKTENNEKGAKIAEVSKESAAEKAGLKAGDVITQINSDKIADPQSLVESIGKLHPQDLVDVTVLRDGKEKKFKAELGKNMQENNQSFNWDNNNGFNFQAPEKPERPERPERPEIPERQNFQRNFNFDFNDNDNHFFNRDEKPKFGFSIKDNENADGAVITSIKDGSNAAKAGLQVNDVVTEIDGNPTKSTDDLKGQLRNINDKSSVKIKVLRNGKTESINVNVPKRIKTADL